MTTGIVILNYNNYTATINCIRSIFKHSSDNSYNIVVVDNCSINKSIYEIAIYFTNNNLQIQIIEENEKIKANSPFTLIKTNKNLGYARGNNIGINFLLQQNVDYILISNNDIILTDDVITPLCQCLNNNMEIGLLSPLLIKRDGTAEYNCCKNNPSSKMFLFESLAFLKLPFVNRAIDKKFPLKTNSNLFNQDLVFCDIVSGSFILAKKNTWELLKGFDENTFLYYEENILFEKLKQFNLKSAILTSVRAIHLGGESTKKVKNTQLLNIELESLKYYLKMYRKLSPAFIALITFILTLRIKLVALNNLFKSLIKR